MIRITLFTAFSRDQESKLYVQHVIRDNELRLKAFFYDNKESFRIYVAGNSKDMPQAVEKAIKAIFTVVCKDNQEEGDRWYERLFKEGRIQFETWH